ncbi:hypothetical protein TorRG33x02_319660 [Trema orientale]|uniref:Uncharacterized protein n=1 Tax=Trema orientale TaxID=63057 RepID=A0A2P5BIS2_TREOI|nr:hypothetical protein TorRG33x02_319660 [Trema orientale]
MLTTSVMTLCPKPVPVHFDITANILLSKSSAILIKGYYDKLEGISNNKHKLWTRQEQGSFINFELLGFARFVENSVFEALFLHRLGVGLVFVSLQAQGGFSFSGFFNSLLLGLWIPLVTAKAAAEAAWDWR